MLRLRGKIIFFSVSFSLVALSMISILILIFRQDQEINSYKSNAQTTVLKWQNIVLKHTIEGNDLESLQRIPSFRRDLAKLAPLADAALYKLESTGDQQLHFTRWVVDAGDQMPKTIPDSIKKDQFVYENDRLLYHYSQITPLGEYLLRFHLTKNNQTTLLSDVYFLLAKVAFVLALLAIIMAFVAHYSFIRPLQILNDSTRRVADGDLNHQVLLPTGDEMESLATSFNIMVNKVNEMQNNALEANPLTGLPGNNCITRRMDISLKEKNNEVVIYIDIDNFKAYNDVYGFDAGDKAIAMIANILKACTEMLNTTVAFLGHVGGDDFIAIIHHAEVNSFVADITRNINKQVPSLYSEKDIARQGIETKDRQGVLRFFPFISLSMAGIRVDKKRFKHVGEIAAVAAEMKKIAKSKPGCSYVSDRRGRKNRKIRV